MTVIAGPAITPTGNGLIYFSDPGNKKSYSSTENLYPTSENWGLMLTSSTPSPYYQVSAGGPDGGAYYVTTVTNTVSSNYWFEWGNTVSLNAGDTVTQTFHIRPITTSSGTLQTAALQFWTGAGRAWTTTRYVQFTLGTTASVLSYSFGTSTGSISVLDNGWYRISQTAIADQAGYSGMSLFLSGAVGFNTGTIYHFAAAQIEKNPQFTGYTPTYGTAITRGTGLSDLSLTSSTLSTFVNGNAVYYPANGGYLNLGPANYVSNNITNYAYINTPLSGTRFSATSDFTISTWFNFGNNFSTLTNVMGTLAGSLYFNGWGLQWFGNTTTYQISTWVRTSVGIVGCYNAYDSAGPGDGYNCNTSTWYNATMVYSTINAYHAIYVNGQLANIANPPLTTGTFVVTNPNFNIGSSNGSGGGATQVPFPGSFGPTQVYNRMLSSDEIQQNFNAFRGRYGI